MIGQRGIVAERNNTPILLRDLAEVKFAPALRSGDALIMGKPGVMLSLVEPVWRQYTDGHPGGGAGAGQFGTCAQSWQGNFIDVCRLAGRLRQFHRAGTAEISGSRWPSPAVLILAVLYLFLRDIRAALIAFTAIPLSLLAAVAVLDHMGLTSQPLP